MKFKEKWSILKYENDMEIGNEKEELICSFPVINDKFLAYSKIIVCVPEMLDMLEEFIHMFSDPNNSCSELELINEAKELIKKATL